MNFKSPSKVNLGLQVLDQRPDGYHNLLTIFQELDFCDNITLEEIAGGCEIYSTAAWLPTGPENTCRRAYGLLHNRFPDMPGVRIMIEKNIPAGAGLGGGSANAAAVLKGLNRLFHLGLSGENLEQIATEIGADVPFFINGGTQVGAGVGEKLTPLGQVAAGWYLLVVPPIEINTARAYDDLKKHLNPRRKKINFTGFFQGRNTPWELFENDFERIVIPTHPEVGEIKKALQQGGAYYASLSGSGSTVFGIFDDEAAVRAVESVFKNSCKTILARPVST